MPVTTLDSSFHTEITLLRGSDGPRTSPTTLLLSFTQEDKSLPHAQQYMITAYEAHVITHA